MKIKATADEDTLGDGLESITLIAKTAGERQWLAGLLRALDRLDWEWVARPHGDIPNITIKD